MRPLLLFFKYSSVTLLVLIIFLSLISLSVIASPILENKSVKGTEFKNLANRLILDGFDPKKINNLFAKDSIFFNPSGVSLFFVHSEGNLNYDQFLSNPSIARAMTYLKAHEQTLLRAESEYGVDKTIIVAILLVETRLGSYLGRRTVINTLATMAALNDPALREKIWSAIPEVKKMERKDFLKKVEKRSKWGYEELQAMLKYTEREGIPAEIIKGSYAGAMGIPQFMPSNALTLASDGNNDGKIDLFNHEDTIFSVANFLKHHGWRSDLNRQDKNSVLFHYNHSQYYVNTLMKISDKLKQG